MDCPCEARPSNVFPVVYFLLGSENGRCVASEYFTEPDIEITTENTANILSECNTHTHTVLDSSGKGAAADG